ncbi:MAG: restriction endonuclease subunit R [Spirulinaceae cyanobacterium RM2_2_10]|nr:restriction endonuclease subunit R [Spirulinaceae cyanobacterium SM2_1_0]NJO20763.1 restriction endonuclease subunit R [Spirulinaceae cyanobacterium RM2_2_10]
MPATLAASNINLRDLIDRFGLVRSRDDRFFFEWQTDLPLLTASEQQQLDRIREGYFNLIENPPLLESVVKLAIVSPLLFIAGVYLAPFQIRAEQSIELAAEDEGQTIEGRIDILLLRDNIWVAVIESKQFAFSTDEALAQILTYMLADPQPDTPTYGLIATGANFTFVKLARLEGVPHYARSDEFVIRNRDNGLYPVLQIFKRLMGVGV